MVKTIASMAVAISISLPAFAADKMTREQIQQVIDTTDAAAMNRDTQGIGEYLGENFEKKIEVPHGKWMASVKINKDQYLAIIDQGWAFLQEYDYRRESTVINIAPDGLSAESSSTITETSVIDGEKMVSKFREYARYELENGRVVITSVGGHTLVGDTTPSSGQ